MVQAALSTIGTALGNQSRPMGARREARQDHTTAAIAMMPKGRLSKKAKENADAERLLYLFTQPEIIGLLSLFAGLFVSNKIPFSEDPATNELMQSLAIIGTCLISLGNAGVGDLTTTTVALTAGASNFLLNADLGGLIGIGPDTSAEDKVGLLDKFFRFLSPLNPLNYTP